MDTNEIEYRLACGFFWNSGFLEQRRRKATVRINPETDIWEYLLDEDERKRQDVFSKKIRDEYYVSLASQR
jgi:hypothetical protein